MTALTFLHPWAFAALIALPVLWVLLKITPPAPKEYVFPALRLLANIKKTDETPHKTPLWLIVLRSLLLVSITLGLSGPIWLENPSQANTPHRPLLLLVDDDWAAAPQWPALQERARQILHKAEQDKRAVRLIFTSLPPSEPFKLDDSAEAALAELDRHAPVSWPISRSALAPFLKSKASDFEAIYLSSGMESLSDESFFEGLSQASPVRLEKAVVFQPLILKDVSASENGLKVTIQRAPPYQKREINLRALGPDGQILAQQKIALNETHPQTEATLILPADVRHLVTRLDSPDETSAAAVWLSDSYWRSKEVGLVTARSDSDKPLIGDLYYLRRAMQPFASPQAADLDTLLKKPLSLLVLSDITRLADEQVSKLQDWITHGGVLVRFAGEQLASATSEDPLLPLPLRQGVRVVGGSLSWTKPLTLQSFTENAPLAGLKLPSDVTISKQIIPDMQADLQLSTAQPIAQTWATLSDGTPLVSAKPIGQGWLILVHTAASPDWTSLVYSGLFVDLFERFIHLSSGESLSDLNQPLSALSTLDGFGAMASPAPYIKPLAPAPDTSSPITAQASFDTPPGYYGSSSTRFALNLGPSLALPLPVSPSAGLSWANSKDTTSGDVNLSGFFLVLALALSSIDFLATLVLRGFITLNRKAFLPLLIAALLTPVTVHAQDMSSSLNDEMNTTISSDIYLGYIKTGAPSTDDSVRDGLKGLQRILSMRTIVQPRGVIGLDPASDDLSFYPLLYWAITPSQPTLSEAARTSLNTYLKGGGLLLIDTRDGDDVSTLATNQTLIRLMQGIDLPPLTMLPENHVLSRSFYLLNDFSGLWPLKTLLVEETEGSSQNDSVSGVVMGTADWASAWAMRTDGRPAIPLPSGGERQREYAYRFGVNLMMYALTGNYKSDQVHLKTILERIGKSQ